MTHTRTPNRFECWPGPTLGGSPTWFVDRADFERYLRTHALAATPDWQWMSSPRGSAWGDTADLPSEHAGAPTILVRRRPPERDDTLSIEGVDGDIIFASLLQVVEEQTDERPHAIAVAVWHYLQGWV